MKTFTDVEGRHWNIRGTLGTFERVKTATGVDMLDLPTTQQCLRDISDVFKLGAVLYVVCEQQAQERGISPEQFSDSFNADTLHAAADALIEETIFFCRSDVRPALEMAYEKAKLAEKKAVEVMQTRLAALGKEMDAALENLSTPTDSVTNLPESSASIPASGRSAASSGRRRRNNASDGITRRAS
jgi:hypothetical protein